MDILELRLALFGKLLEQDRPVVTEKMLPLLLQEGAASVLINFITKTNPSVVYSPPPLVPAGLSLPLAGNCGTTFENTTDQRAAKAVSLFADLSAAFAHFISKRTEELVVSLFAIFEGSQGLQCDMILWQRCCERIATLEPVRVAEVIESNHALFSTAIPFMVHTPVMSVLLCCIDTFAKIGISRKLMWMVRQASRNVCADGDLGLGSMEVVLKLLETYGEGFMRLEKGSAKEFAFFLPLTEPEFISKLIGNVNSNMPTSAHAFEVLAAYAKLGGTLSRLIVNNVAVLGEAVLNLDRSGTISPEKLTLVRWGLVDVLSTLATNPDSSKQTLDSISIDMWRALSSWFLNFHLSSLCKIYLYSQRMIFCSVNNIL
jgi:hypothetical protein